MPGIDNLNLPAVSPYSSYTRFSQSFQQFVKDIADAKSKGEEDRIILNEIARIRNEISKPNIPSKIQKEQFIKLMYAEILGHPVPFAYMEAVKFAQQEHLLNKRVAYAALGLFLNEKNETECMMNIGSIRRDLESSNILNICFGLIAASNLVYKDVVQAVLPPVIVLTKDKRDMVRQKAVMTLFSFWQIHPEACDFVQYFHLALFDKDPAVMGASLTIYLKLIQENPLPYKKLTGSFVSILKQVIDKKLPEEYNYRNITAPWMQINLLKILAHLGSDDVEQSKQMYEVLRLCLDITPTDINIGCSVIYECMKTVANIYVNRSLIEISTNKATLFILSDDYNLKYLGIKILSEFVALDASYATRHQQIIIECLNDQDDSLKRKTLDLLYRMTNVTNVKVICEKMLDYLRSTMDDYVRADLVSRLTTLAEKFAPDNEWYIETMNEVFELGGNLVQDEVAYNMMEIIGEGVDDGDDEEESSATTDLRRNAVFAYVNLMDKPILPDVLIKLICWVVGEYLNAEDGYDIGDITKTFYGMLYRRFSDKITQSWIITAIMKILSRCERPHLYMQPVNLNYLHPDAKQRYFELQSILDLCIDVEEVLPYDASCEEIEVDEDLHFLDHFVQEALNSGAQPYSKQEEEDKQVDDKEHEGGLIFIHKRPQQDNGREDQIRREDQTKREETPVSSPILSSPEPVITSTATRKPKTLWTSEGRMGESSRESEDVEATNIETYSNKSSEKEASISTPTTSSETEEPSYQQVRSQKDEILRNALFGQGTTARTTQKQSWRIKPTGSNTTHTYQRKQREKPNQANTRKQDLDSKKQQGDQDILLGMTETTNQMDQEFQKDLLLDANPSSALNLLTDLDKITTTPEDLLSTDAQVEGGEVLLPSATEVMSNQIPTQSPVHSISQLLVYESDPAVTLSEDLRGFKNSAAVEVANDICLRVSSQHVYKPNELLLVFSILNKTAHPLTSIALHITCPSSLRGTELDFSTETLEGNTFVTHTLRITNRTPAHHFILDGHTTYKDYTNTEKKLFLKLPVKWSDLLRPLVISIDDFADRWTNKSLRERKETKAISLHLDALKSLLDELNIGVIQQEGSELINACTILGGDVILIPIKAQKTNIDIRIKSTSEKLNECLCRFLLDSL